VPGAAIERKLKAGRVDLVQLKGIVERSFTLTRILKEIKNPRPGLRRVERAGLVTRAEPT
jgi:hypothetical protein